MPTQQFPYDIFISYAHRDDHDGWVETFVQAIRDEHARFTPTPLEIFFDHEEIETMHDWEHRILRGLRGSKVMVAVLSPHYFQSAYCRKEWEIYLDHELDHAMTGQGIAPIYIVSFPDFEYDSKAAVDEWIMNLRRRQYLDIRQWREHGPTMLRHEDVQRRLESLGQHLSDRLQLAERISDSPTTVPQHNRNFIGRIDELRQLREALAFSRIGTVAVVQGLSGMGKSALTFEYAHAYAGEYPGGRFLVSAAGVDDLRIPIVNLAEQKGVTLSEDERKDIGAAFLRVKAAFEQGPRSLLLLDGVDNPALLSAKSRAAWLPTGDSIHVIATTTLGIEAQAGLHIINLDALSERDALTLLERHRPFDSDEEREAAREIAKRLGGHSLAIEVVGVYLWQTPDVNYEGYLARLGFEGLEAVEGVAREENIELSRHHNSILTELMEPTLAQLKTAEIVALEYAALLPKDHVALPWLRDLAGQLFPELTANPKPGYPDPWKQTQRRLFGLRLLTQSEDTRMARIHRLTQDVVTARVEDEVKIQRQGSLITYALGRGAWIAAEWSHRENRWEIEPLLNYALQLLDSGDAQNGPVLANRVSDAVLSLGRYEEGARLLRQAIAVRETIGDDLVLAESCSNLALAQQAMGNLTEARALLERALLVWEKTPESGVDLAMGLSNLALVEQEENKLEAAQKLLLRAITLEETALGPEHPNLATSLSNLATVESELGHFKAARDLLLRAAAIDEKSSGAEHPNLAIRFANLSSVEQAMGHLKAAGDWMKKAVDIFEAILEPDHPHLAITCSNLAMIERDLGNTAEAHELLTKAIAIEEKIYAPEHPNLAVRYSNLALVEQDLGNLVEAKALLERASASIEASSGADHPNLAAMLSNLALVERDLGNLKVAQEQLNRAIAIDEATFGPQHANAASSYSKLATVERLLGNLDEAWELLYLAVAVQTEALGPDHPRLALSQFRLAEVEFDRQNFGEAQQLALNAYKTQLSVLGEAHRDTRQTAHWLTEKGWLS